MAQKFVHFYNYHTPMKRTKTGVFVYLNCGCKILADSEASLENLPTDLIFKQNRLYIPYPQINSCNLKLDSFTTSFETISLQGEGNASN